MKAVILCLTISAASFFYAWTTDDGVLSFTDSKKRIPAKYRGAVSERTWQDVRARAALIEKK